jgi:hypothetical protein
MRLMFFLGFDQFGFEYFINNEVLHKRKTTKILNTKSLFGKNNQGRSAKSAKNRLILWKLQFCAPLDNQLNEIQKINFSSNANPIVITATGIASQNQLWVYNSLNQQIGLWLYKNEYKTISTLSRKHKTLSDWFQYLRLDRLPEWQFLRRFWNDNDQR